MLKILCVAFTTILCYHIFIKIASNYFRGNKTLKKNVVTLLLASFILTNLSPVACFAVGENNNAKKISISKSHKQRAKSDKFKYEYINYKWWDSFNDPLLTGYIDKAIQNNQLIKDH